MMRTFYQFMNVGLVTFVLVSSLAIAKDRPDKEAEEALSNIQQRWAQCQYQQTGKDQESCFEAVIALNEAVTESNPFADDLKLWLAINTSSLANAKGGIAALKLVKRSKALLEQVIDRNGETLEGTAYTSLGLLYYRVPSWPLSFGDDEKAESLLLRALEISPENIDSNYFYADFLISKRRYNESRPYLRKAQQAQPRPGRSLADAGRQKEVAAALEKVNSKVKG